MKPRSRGRGSPSGPPLATLVVVIITSCIAQAASAHPGRLPAGAAAAPAARRTALLPRAMLAGGAPAARSDPGTPPPPPPPAAARHNATTIITARVLSCLWPPHDPGRPGAVTTMSGAVGAAAAAGLPARAALAGASPLANLQLLCAYADPAARGGAALAVRPRDLPAIVAVHGLPLEHCALGVPLQLSYLVTLAPPALPGGPRRVVASAPVVGEGRRAAAGGGGRRALVERFCLVDTPRRTS
jgi:hypothetical protein